MIYKESSEEKRNKYLKLLSEIDPKNIVYVDESGISKYLHREYGRAVRGKKVIDKIPGRKFERTNIVSGLLNNNPIAPLIYKVNTDSNLFEFWFENCLMKEISEDNIIVLDNASFHRKEKLENISQKYKEKLENISQKYNVRTIFLPPYSPDLNPIEKFWANLKKKLSKIIENFSSLWEALRFCFKVE